MTTSRALWVQRYMELRTVDFSTAISSLETNTLWRKVVRNALVEEQWKRNMEIPHKLTKVYKSSNIIAAKLLPGGSEMVIIWADGRMQLRSTSPNDSLKELQTVYPYACPKNNSGFTVFEFKLLPAFENPGYLILSLCHDHDDLEVPHKYVLTFLSQKIIA